MTVNEALQRFTLLSIGDGLVSQIPALITSTAAGILVTRAAAKEELGNELTKQLLSYPRVMTILTAMLVVFALVPGLPMFPFMFLAGCTGFLAYNLTGQERSRQGKNRRRGGCAGRRLRQGRGQRRRQFGQIRVSPEPGRPPNRTGLRPYQPGRRPQRRRPARARHRRAQDLRPGDGNDHPAHPPARQFAIGSQPVSFSCSKATPSWKAN
jgi:hypothetical protein